MSKSYFKGVFSFDESIVLRRNLHTSPATTSPLFLKNTSLKGLQKTLRGKWLRGPVSKFDKLLSQIEKCDLETAQKIRESWIDLDLLAYDSDGFLVWCGMGFFDFTKSDRKK